MSNTYKATVNKDFIFDITDKDINNLDTIPITLSKHHILKNNTSYHTDILTSDFRTKTYTINVNNNIYEVVIADALDTLINDMGFDISASKQIQDIKAPMPGLLLDIQVKVGQTVKKDDYLLVLEAMKMENIITSPRDGIIKSITATVGDAVDKGQLLIEFE